MKFKKTAYRMGFGTNVKGKMVDGKYVIYYKTRDGVVNVKEIIPQAGRVDLVKVNKSFNATTVIPLDGGYILTNLDKEIKSIKI